MLDPYGIYAAGNPYGVTSVDYYDSRPRSLLSGPDPYGPVADQYRPSDGYGGYDDYGPPSGMDILSQLIRAGATTAQIAEAGYPPGSTNIVYAPGYPGQPTPPPYPTPPGYQPPIVTQRPGSQPGFSFTGDKSLWVFAGLALLLFAGMGRRR